MKNESKSRWPVWEDTQWYAAIKAEGLSRERLILLEYLLTMGNLTMAAKVSGVTRRQTKTVVDATPAGDGRDSAGGGRPGEGGA